MKRVVVVSACRTPIGKIPGELNFISDTDLLASTFQEVIKRSGISNELIDEAYVGCSFPVERDNICRKAILKANLSPTISGSTISKTCASSDEAIMHAVYKIKCNEAEMVLVGGIEKISNSSYALHFLKQNVKNIVKKKLLSYKDIPKSLQENDMALLYEILSKKYNISRLQQDRFTIESIEKAQKANEEGRFSDELFNIVYRSAENEHKLYMDELLMSNKYEDQIKNAAPIFLSDGVLTQYNTSLMCDGAAAILLMDYDRAISMGLKPLAEVYAVASIGINNDNMGLCMGEAIKHILKENGLHKDDIGLYELNESFAVQALLCQKQLCIDDEKINVNGGNLALGYPIGCTGMRMNITLIHEMMRRNTEFGLSAIGAGGNMGHAIIYRNVK